MGRPKFLNCIMTPKIISAIRQEQEYYDKDPKEYERQKREAEEKYLQEQEEMRHQERLEQEKQQENNY